jgi:hypothetical protein
MQPSPRQPQLEAAKASCQANLAASVAPERASEAHSLARLPAPSSNASLSTAPRSRPAWGTSAAAQGQTRAAPYPAVEAAWAPEGSRPYRGAGVP